MSEIQDYQVSFSLQVNIEDAYEEIRRLQTVLYRIMGLLRRMGLPEEIDEAIAKIQRLITILNTLRLTIAALHAAAGPIGWLLAGVSMITTGATISEYIMEMGP